MNLSAYLKVGPRGRIYLPAEFHEHMGLPAGPAYIEAKLCVDGYVELGPVIPGPELPRNLGKYPGLMVPGTFDDPLPAGELAAWESDRDLIVHDVRDPWSGVSEAAEDRAARVRQISEEVAEPSVESSRRRRDPEPDSDVDLPPAEESDSEFYELCRELLSIELREHLDAAAARPGGVTPRRAESSLPDGWAVAVDGHRVHVRIPRMTFAEHWLSPIEARLLGLALRIQALIAASESGRGGGQ